MNRHMDVSGSPGPGLRTRLSSRDSLVPFEAVLLVAGALGGLVLLLAEESVIASEGDLLDTAIDVTAGLFAVQLTVITFVVVFAVDTSTDWPSLRSMVRYSGLAQWLVAGFLGFALFAFVEGSVAREALALFCVVVVVAGFVPIKLLFEITSERGRDGLLVSDLEIGQGLKKQRWRSPGTTQDSAALLGSFTSVFQSSLNEDELLRLKSLVNQLTASRADAQDPEGLALLTRAQLHLWSMQRITRAILFGQINSASSTELLRTLTASLCRSTIADRRVAGRIDPASEVEAACVLGITGRFLAWTARVSARLADAASPKGPSPDPRSFHLYRSLFEVSVGSQKIIGKHIDPDPPDVYLPADERERSHGLVDPEAGLIWWITSVDQNGSNPGVYQLAEILTGEKFFGSFGWGYRSVLGEINERLEATRGTGDSAPFPVRPGSVRLLDSFGGLGEVSAEALALSLSTWENFGTVGVGAGLGWAYTRDPARLARRIRVLCLGGPEFSHSEDGLRLALERIARFTGPLEGSDKPLFSHHAFRKAANVFGGAGQSIPGAGKNLIFPHLSPLQERPGAAVLSVAIRCVDFTRSADFDSEFIRTLLESLPTPLLASALETASRIFPGEVRTGVSGTPEMADDIIERLEALGADLQET